MYRSFEAWEKKAVSSTKKSPLEVVDKLSSLGADNAKVWGYFFVNLAYASNLVNLFVKSCRFNATYSMNFLWRRSTVLIRTRRRKTYCRL